VIDQATGKPMRGVVCTGVLLDNPFAKEYSAFGAGAFNSRVETAADGTFRIVTIPGPMLLMGGPDYAKMPEGILASFRYKPQMSDPKHPKYFPKGPGEGVLYYTLGGARAVLQGPFVKVLDIKPDAGTVEQDVVLQRASELPVKIVDAAHRPVKGTQVTGMSPRDWNSPIQIAEATCNVYHLVPGTPRLVVVYDPVGKQFGTLRLKGDERDSAVVKLGPGATVKGRLIDEKGRPLSGVGVGVHHTERTADEIRARVCPSRVTDADGKFTVEVVPGAAFKIHFTRGKRTFRPVKTDEPVAPGKTLDLSDVKIDLSANLPG
jgi:hypothetical protein